jgi:integrase
VQDPQTIHQEFDAFEEINVPRRHRTAPIPGTMTQVPYYPRKLKIYLHNASPYWWATYYDKGKTYRHSCKTKNKLEAFKQARIFYEQLLLKKYQHPAHLESHPIIKEKQGPKRALQDLRFKTIAAQWLARKSTKWTPNHQKQVELRLTNNILKFIADKNIQRITRNDLLELLQKMEERGAYNLARRVLNDCRQIWQYSMVIGVCRHDITFGLGQALHGHATVHFHAVSPKEFPKLMQDIANFNKEGDEIIKYALQLIALTFVRKYELLLARWDEFDLKKGIWKIPAARMKMRVEHIVPLSSQALNILKHLQTQYPSEGYLFYKVNPEKPLVDHALIYALYWLGYKHRMTVHGFRAIASTVLNEHEFRSDVIERQLAHTEGNQVRRAYNRAQYMNERIVMMQWWGDYLEKIAPF